MNNFPTFLTPLILKERRYRVDQHLEIIGFDQLFSETAAEFNEFIGQTERRALGGITHAAYAYFQHHKACGNKFADKEWGIEVTGLTPLYLEQGKINIRWCTAWLGGLRYPMHGEPESLFPLGYFNEFDLYLAAQSFGLPYTLIARYGHRDAYISMPVSIMPADVIDASIAPLQEAYHRALYFGCGDLMKTRG